MLKRAGWGNDPHRTVEATRDGELAILCPACPWPNVNLLKEWKEQDKQLRSNV